MYILSMCQFSVIFDIVALGSVCLEIFCLLVQDWWELMYILKIKSTVLLSTLTLLRAASNAVMFITGLSVYVQINLTDCAIY